MMRASDLTPVLTLLDAAKNAGRILVVTHERPDGDAVGSSVGLWNLLNGNGFRADLFIQDAVPDFYRTFVPANAPVPTAATLKSDYAALVSVDASTGKRLGLAGIDPAVVTIPFAALDHHPDHQDFAPVVYVDSGASSASEVVFQLARTAQWKISPDAATALLLGVTTDTGGFRFDNTSAASLRSAAELLDAGANHHRVIEKAFFSKPFNMAQFEAELFCGWLRTACDGRFAWFMIPDELLKKYRIDIRNTENLIENVRGIEGVEVAALIKPTASPGIFKISLRSKNPAVSVGKIARRLNGGGHELAAGGTIFAKSGEEAENILLKHVEMELK